MQLQVASMENDLWEMRWQQGQTPWDLGNASPALMEYARQIEPGRLTALRVLIPGCGNGYEALELAKMGFQNITLLDIAPTAIALLQQRLDQLSDFRHAFHLRCEDFFDHQGKYDLILEQTFFCALHPSLRRKYVRKMADLLAPGGKLVGVLFNRHFEGGPPYGGFTEEYRQLFAPFFDILTLETCYNSIAPRARSEVFFIFKVKSKGAVTS